MNDEKLTPVQKQNARSRKIFADGSAWFGALAEIHKDHIARKALFSELEKAFQHYGEKLDKELIRIDNLPEGY